MSEFSKIPEERIIYTSEHFLLIRDRHPVSKGHTLIISKEEKLHFFDLSRVETNELIPMIHKAKELPIVRDASQAIRPVLSPVEHHRFPINLHFYLHLINPRSPSFNYSSTVKLPTIFPFLSMIG